jgi:hypothetical protein
MRAPLLFALVLALIVLQQAESIYFHVVEGQSKCFIEEVPSETLVVASYKNPDFVEFGKPDFTGTVRQTTHMGCARAAPAPGGRSAPRATSKSCFLWERRATILLVAELACEASRTARGRRGPAAAPRSMGS